LRPLEGTMKTSTMKKMSRGLRRERAAALREAARQIESCWMTDSLGAAREFIEGDPHVADHLGALDPPRWMAPLVCGDPQKCVRTLLAEARIYET
jgi:hypothetical protein